MHIYLYKVSYLYYDKRAMTNLSKLYQIYDLCLYDCTNSRDKILINRHLFVFVYDNTMST